MDATSPGGCPSPSKRWRRAVARVCAQKAVLHALEPEPAWREWRPYVALLVSGFFFSPISQAILVTSVDVSRAGPGTNAWRRAGLRAYWWWPLLWWRGLKEVLASALSLRTLPRYLTSSALFAVHDAVTRGRTHWVEQATDVGAARPKQPFWRCFFVETCCGLLGAQLSLEYMRGSLSSFLDGGSSAPSWVFRCPSMLGLGACAAAARSVVVSTGGRRPGLQSICSWLEFFLEVAAERQGALHLGYHCPLGSYLGVVLWGILNFLPWGLMVIPCKRLVEHIFGPDPIVAQKAALCRVSRDLMQSERGRSELAEAPQRAHEFFASMEISSLWWRVRAIRGTHQLLRRLQLPMREALAEPPCSGWDAAQDQLDELLLQLAARRGEDLKALLQEEDGTVNEQCVVQVFDSATALVTVRRNDMVRSALTQIAERSVDDLLLGITALHFPGLQETELTNMLGLRVQFMGEDAVDMGGVRKEFMDCFAEALTKEEGGSPLSLVEPLNLLGLGADSTWRPLACDEDERGYLWALGRLLALAFLYRCPCPIQLSLLVFKCILGVPLRPGDVRQLDVDFWNHRVRPILKPGGVEERQTSLKHWGMDPLTFTSADGRELMPDGHTTLVTEQNKEDYAQLLCEDFLIGSIRPEISCLMLGFHELVPEDLLSASSLDAEQLRMLICGTNELDVDEWEENAITEGSPEVVGWFFDWLRKQSALARSKMLAFVTGSSVLPCGWQGLRDPQGRYLPFRVQVEGNPSALPSAHTCTNLLVLPPVGERFQLESKLAKVLEFAGREMLLA
ncbi:unnamed protein product [Durusdinium trenchii]|uniref:HECT-type E3 ubiquitin transferase n=1 Tax=Durusdinium trenchii TaxID=1381693 RepID=A0ABP0PIK2_9DINO